MNNAHVSCSVASLVAFDDIFANYNYCRHFAKNEVFH